MFGWGWGKDICFVGRLAYCKRAGCVACRFSQSYGKNGNTEINRNFNEMCGDAGITNDMNLVEWSG